MKVFCNPAANRCARMYMRAFTLIELMLSMAVLGLLMALLLSTVGETQRVWTRTTSKINQFQASRTAFEAVTRNLSQATLNTYYDLQFEGTTGNTKGYSRSSDLHFLSGKAAQAKFFGTDAATYPTHAVFFQAPTGFTGQTTGTGATVARKYRSLSNLLSVVGYYVKWGVDENVPAFVKPHVSDKYRYRLMEAVQPSESFSVNNTLAFPKATDWIHAAVGLKALPSSTDPNAPKGMQNSSRPLAENIIALIVLPKLSDKDTAAPFLSPNYEYDSRPADSAGKPKLRKDIADGSNEYRQFNQLPPVVRVTIVAIDEASAARQQDLTKTVAPKWTDGLFTTASKEEDLAKDLGDPEEPGTNTLIYRLNPPAGSAGRRMNYRIYTMDVVIRGSKWSN